MSARTPKTLPLNGYRIPVEHYERVRRLFAMAYGLTDVRVDEREATRAAMDAALAAQSAMFLELRHRRVLGDDES